MGTEPIIISLLKLFGIGAAQVTSWWWMMVLYNKVVGRKTANDYSAALEGLWGPAIIRAGTMVSLAIIIGLAGLRWV